MIRALALASVLAACSSPPPVARPPEAAPSSPVPWVQARAADTLPVLEAPARVIGAPESEAVVAPPFLARVTRIHVQPGQRVSRDAPIVDVVVPQVLEAAGAASGAALRRAAWEKRRAQLAALDKEGLAKMADVVEAETQLAEAQASLETARATLQAAGLTLARAKELLAGTGTLVLRAPISGMVVELSATLGATAAPEGPPFARIAGSAEVRVEARVARAAPPDARYEFVGPDAAALPVRLVSASPRVDARDGSYPAWFAFLSRPSLPAGTPGRLVARLEPEAGVVAVPARAVGLEAGRAFVFARRGEAPVRVPVEVVASGGAETLVRAAEGATLAPGDELAADLGRVDAARGDAP